MAADDEFIRWARREAGRLRQVAIAGGNDAEATRAQEFLRQRAPRSAFYRGATDLRGSTRYRLDCVADALDGWAGFAEEGMAATVPYDSQFRVDAATDLMEQVNVLLKDRDVHPAVPVMVAGAALEEFLRSMLETTTEAVSGDPSITKYGEALKRAGAIDREAAHQVTSMAATRNKAAHGEFDTLSRDVAEVFVQRVNLFISQHKSA
jgi:hypothetical protein